MPPQSPSLSASRCAACDYDLTGTPVHAQQRCPECGLELSEEEIALARERSLFRDLRRTIALAASILLAVGVASVILFRDHLLFLVPILLLLIAPLGLIALAAFAERRLGR